MIDLKGITERLNKDPQELAKFVADPAGYLKAAGIPLTQQQAEELVKAIKDPKSPRPIAERSIEAVQGVVGNSGASLKGPVGIIGNQGGNIRGEKPEGIISNSGAGIKEEKFQSIIGNVAGNIKGDKE